MIKNDHYETETTAEAVLKPFFSKSHKKKRLPTALSLLTSPKLPSTEPDGLLL